MISTICFQKTTISKSATIRTRQPIRGNHKFRAFTAKKIGIWTKTVRLKCPGKSLYFDRRLDQSNTVRLFCKSYKPLLLFAFLTPILKSRDDSVAALLKQQLRKRVLWMLTPTLHMPMPSSGADVHRQAVERKEFTIGLPRNPELLR